MTICKTAQGLHEVPGVDEEQLTHINRYARRPLAADEVYTFSLLLCDNEIDRDFERFSDSALDALGNLFLGKTGVFDHQPTAGNQAARIFRTQVLEDAARRNTLGQPYRCLKAWAYMLRCSKNQDLILEIDGGIKKEVSVGCAVGQAVCSICGANLHEAPCTHRKGGEYGGRLCYHELLDPTDAYEWSFVAVPAQRAAGVTKHLRPGCEGGPTTLKALLDERGSVTLTQADLAGLRQEYDVLKAQARAGAAHLQALRREVVKLGLLCQKGLDPQVMEEVAAAMDLRQLTAFRKAYAQQAQQHYPMPQLAGHHGTGGDSSGIAPFRLERD